MPVVGFLNGASPTELGSRVVAFRDGLAEKAYVEGRSVAIEYRLLRDLLPGAKMLGVPVPLPEDGLHCVRSGRRGRAARSCAMI